MNTADRIARLAALLQGDITSVGLPVGKVANVDELHGFMADKEELEYGALSRALYEGLADIHDGVIQGSFSMTTFLQAGGSNRIPVDRAHTDALQQEIMPHGQPATFGDILNQQTRVDPSVRVATEFTKYHWTEKGREIESVRECQTQASSLVSSCPHITVGLKRMKLNFYASGGFFVEHVDHPEEAANTIASVVIIFPTDFQGGELVLRTANGDVTVTGPNSDEFKYAIFPCTMPHQVLPVTEGCRVTVTFAVNMQDDGITPIGITMGHMTIDERTLHAAETLRAALESKQSLMQLGILCRGKYTMEALERHELNAVAHQKDQELVRLLQLVGVRDLQVCSVVCNYHSCLNWVHEREDDFDSQVYYVSSALYEKALNTDCQLEPVLPDWTQKTTEFYWMFSREDNGVQMTRTEKPAYEYTGNEAEAGSIDCLYFHAALVFALGDPSPPKSAQTIGKKRKRSRCQSADA